MSLPLADVSVSPFYAFSTSDFVGKLIILILFIASITSWTIMIDKKIHLSRLIKSSKRFKEKFRRTSNILSIYNDVKKNIDPLGDLYLKAAAELISFYDIPEEDASKYGTKYFPPQKLTSAQIETIRSVLEQTVSDKIIELEGKMGLLATAVSVSPLLGLFGTVWGIMMAFISMAIRGKADIAGMAPGISGALLTTVAGLLVAIPSVIGYNFLSNNISELTVHMDNFVEEFISKIKLEQHALNVSEK